MTQANVAARPTDFKKPINILPLHAREISIAFGGSAEAKVWRNRDLTIDDMLIGLRSHKAGDKDGRAFLQGALSKDGRRVAINVASMDLAAFDVENGQRPDEIGAEFECWIYGTYNDGSTRTAVLADKVATWAKLGPGNEVTPELVIAYLRDDRGFEAWLLVEADVRKDGFNWIVTHAPMPRFRVVVPFSRRIILSELGSTLQEAKQRWVEIYRALARELGIRHYDRSCEDPSRLFYTHRRPADAKPWFKRVAGDLFDPRRLKVVSVKRVTTAAPQGLAQWFAIHGDTFRAADFLREFGKSAEQTSDGGVEAACPNETAHSDGGDGRRTCYAKNPDTSRNGHPAIGCNHQSCQSLKLTDFVSALLREHDSGVDALDPFGAAGLGVDVDFGDVEAARGGSNDGVAIDRLARLPTLDYERVREKEAKRLGIRRVSALDDEVAKRQAELRDQDDEESFLPEVEPWPHAVDGEDLILEIVIILNRYAALPHHADTAIALWAIHTYLHHALWVAPFLAIQSPEKKCGKTVVMDLLGLLVLKPQPSSNVTPAVLARIIDRFRPTVLVDEADTFVALSEELRGVLNSMHRRSSAKVLRCIGDDHEPTPLSTWAPLAMAGIGELPDTIQDRSIVVSLRRILAGEKIGRLRHDRTAEFNLLQRKAARWVADHVDLIKDADPLLPDALDSRAADCWRPLVSIADHIGGIWGAAAREAAIALATGVQADATPQHGRVLLQDCRRVFAKTAADKITPSDQLTALLNVDGSDWSTLNHGRPITASYVGRRLKGYGIISRHGSDGVRYYYRSDFEEAWSRYLPPRSDDAPAEPPVADFDDVPSAERSDIITPFSLPTRNPVVA